MRAAAWLLLLPALTAGLAWAEPAPLPPELPLTLYECYGLALTRSETIAIQQELLKETEGRFLQALSTALPHVSFSSSDTRQDGTGSSSFSLKHIPERKFTISQPLFRGFKEFAAMRGSRAEQQQRAFEKTRAEQLLFVDVSDAFYLLLEKREDLGALEGIRATLLQRLDELRDRVRLGRSRTSEIASAEVRLRRIEAETEVVKSDALLAAQLLEFLTGLPTAGTLADMDALPPLKSAEAYLAVADARPDVRADEEAWRVAQKAVGVAQAKFWPTVDAEGNYYVDRAGVSQDITWDAKLTVDVPLFQGGEAVGAAKEAASKAQQARWAFQRAARTARLDIQDGYTKLRQTEDQTTALERALEAAERNYDLQLEDFRHNLVNNLDVLQALQDVQDTKREVIHAHHERKRLYWQLRADAGALP